MSQTIQIQADWAQTDSTQIDFIKNKPNLYEEWWGTQAEYDAILVKDPNKIYNIITIPNYFYVEDISGSDNTLSIVKYDANAPTIEVFKSADGTNWASMGTTDTTAIEATIPANGKLYLKAVTDRWTGTTYSHRNTIKCSGNHNVGGNIMSLLYGDNFENTTFTNSNKWAFQRLFIQNTTLVNAEDLILPSNTIDYCYSRMFESCDSLTTAPVLPAMVMTQSCYEGMFQYIDHLFTPPALPATTLADGCYGLMFYSSRITTAPALPATVLARNCYESMFYGCASLTTAPVLPATTLVERCYASMFRRARVKSVTTYANDISANDCLNNWLDDVPATGDFYNLGGATYPSGVSGIPTGWTEHNSL